MDVERELKTGIAHQESGALADAARCYKTVLTFDPENVDALYLMSVLATTAGDPQFAVQLAGTAVALQPDYFAPYLSLGNALQALGQAEQAVDAFDQAIALNPASAEAFCNVSSALNEVGRHEDALDAATQALVLNPNLVEATNNFGNALLALGSPGEALECYAKVLSSAPEHAAAWFNQGNAFFELGEFDNAADSFLRSIELEDGAGKHYNLANALYAQGNLEQAAISYCDVIERDFGSMDARINLAVVLREMDRVDEAEGMLREALEIAPEDVDAHFNLSLVLLQQGRLSEAWPEYEWRWRQPVFMALDRGFSQPRWGGAAQADATLLVHVEQGFGDAIQFVRFISQAAQRVGRVVLECRPELEDLFASVAGVDQVVAWGDPLPDFDLHIPLMSLPLVLGVSQDVLQPYLAVPPGAGDFADVGKAGGLKVGVAWAGKMSRRDSVQRACTAADILPLLAVPGLSIFTLQVGVAAEDLRVFGSGVTDLSPRLKSFADTAAAIAELDVVITVDTAVAHLAGALGKPVWVLLSKPSNGVMWLGGRDAQWYPSARIFQQPSQGDWAGLLQQVVRELASPPKV
ncbi:MAG: tetratricopeptide repeat protein [Rhodospirillaceae bacterium]|nr:tetratricopeptide repeat protein [Rhodospirillales bacterium]